MKIFFVDESNITKENRLGFFLCGGLVLKDEEAGSLSRELLRLKEIKWKIPAERPIKWGNPRWGKQSPLNKTLHTEIKAHVLELIGQSSATIITYLSPQDFYHVPSKKSRPVGKLSIDPTKYGRSVLYGLNVVLQRFGANFGGG